MIRISYTIAALLLLSNFAVAQIVGPCVGSVGTTDAFFLYRPGDSEKKLRLSVLSRSGEVVTTTE